jgi:NO-binding membrane sensor protein with MHYT domain
MKDWAFTLLGLIIWAVHFLGVYAIASLADVVSHADDPAWRLGVLAFSLVCGVTALGAGFAAIRRLARDDGAQPGRFMTELAAVGAGIAFVAIIWQALPAL